MSAPLDDLADREMALLAHVRAARGLMEDVERTLREDGTFAAYAAVHADYVALADGPEPDLEALKRALFLSWYQITEPSCFTGVDDLDAHAVARSYAALDRVVGEGRVDDELAAMLGWYEGVHCGWHGCAAPTERALLDSLPADAYKNLGFSREDLERRGQMGDYWISIACRPV